MPTQFVEVIYSLLFVLVAGLVVFASQRHCGSRALTAERASIPLLLTCLLFQSLSTVLPVVADTAGKFSTTFSLVVFFAAAALTIPRILNARQIAAVSCDDFTGSTTSSIESDHQSSPEIKTQETDREAVAQRLLADTLIDRAVYRVSRDGTILSWSKGAMLITGYPPEAAVGTHLTMLETIEDRSQNICNQILSDCGTRGKVDHKVWKVKRDGTAFWASESVVAVRDLQGSILEYLIVVKDLTEQGRNEAAAETHQNQLKMLAVKQEQIREEERARIARELHDVLGQALTVFKLGLNSAIGPLKQRADDSVLFSIGLHLQQMSSNVDYMVKCVRKIASELRPPILDSLGLIPALEWQVEEFSKITSLNCKFVSSTTQLAGDNNQMTAVYRCTQELLTNIARHADARNVVVTFDKQGENMLLEVNDDGKGFNPEEIMKRNTLGLMGIEERAKLAGGDFEIKAACDQGTRALVRIPLKTTNLLAEAR